jgi:hypothetical protein
MNFNIKKFYSIVLMSTLKNAPYVDKLLDDGIIEYEGHDARKSTEYNKKEVDQPMANQNGVLTENGKFFQAADNFKSGKREPAKIKVYRKLRDGVWVDMGFYDLIDKVPHLLLPNERHIKFVLIQVSFLCNVCHSGLLHTSRCRYLIRKYS